MSSPQRLTLAASIVLAAAWLLWPSPERGEQISTPASDPMTTVWERWGLEPEEWPGAIGGRPWEPLSFLDDSAALGVDADGRLLYVERDAGAASATVLSDPGGVPGAVATAATDAHLAWIESVPDDQGRVVSELWIAERDGAGRPGGARSLTADTGDVVAAGGAYDLQFADGYLHWLSTVRASERTTEHRRVRLDGGPVAVEEHPGAWQAAAWPWLTGTGVLGRAELVRADDGSSVFLDADADELAMCSATWCRLIATGADGSRIDLVRPDGTGRVTVAEGFASAVAVDVGLLDRFEPLEESVAEAGDGYRLTLFDLRDSATYLVAESAGRTGADERRLWWSTGSADLRRWHVLDLTDLAR
ncbi:hypothetical protein GCM10027447_32260 [Glycomyces halotolerans]